MTHDTESNEGRPASFLDLTSHIRPPTDAVALARFSLLTVILVLSNVRDGGVTDVWKHYQCDLKTLIRL